MRLVGGRALGDYVGQVEALDPTRHFVVVVLFGSSSPQLIGRLKEKYKDAIEGGLEGPRLLLVDKNPNPAPQEQDHGWFS